MNKAYISIAHRCLSIATALRSCGLGEGMQSNWRWLRRFRAGPSSNANVVGPFLAYDWPEGPQSADFHSTRLNIGYRDVDINLNLLFSLPLTLHSEPAQRSLNRISRGRLVSRFTTNSHSHVSA
jgi:hypothetical protein